MDGLGKNLRLELPSVVGEHTDVRGQVAIDLHETQGGKAVEPRVGHFLHDLLIALFLDIADQRLTLPLFSLRQQMTVHALCVRLTGILRGDPVNKGTLGDALDQLTPCPDRIFLDGIHHQHLGRSAG